MNDNEFQKTVSEKTSDALKGIELELAEVLEKERILNDRKTDLYKKREDCNAAKRLFLGDDLTVESGGSNNKDIVTPERKTIKIRIIEEAKKAYPNPVLARDLKALFEEERGVALGSKTVGMSLYRLSTEGKMRREGVKDWYFVPEN